MICRMVINSLDHLCVIPWQRNGKAICRNKMSKTTMKWWGMRLDENGTNDQRTSEEREEEEEKEKEKNKHENGIISLLV